MPPRLPSTTTRASTPLSPVPAASALPLALTHSSTPSVTQNGKAHLGSSAGKPAVPTRPPSTRPVTPTKHSLQYRSERQLVQASRIRRDASKAIDAAAQNGGKRKGQGKRSEPAPPNQISIADLDDDEDDEDDVIEDEDEHEPNQGNSSSVVPTSDPRELIGQITGETYGDELDDPSFCNTLAGKINGILQDKEKRSQFSRETLQEALRIVRRSPSVSHGSSRLILSIAELPDADSEEVGGREPQSGDKRRSDASQSGPSKRGRAEFSRTPSTVPAVTPPPFGLGRPGGSAPTGRPRTAARPGIAVPKGLPRSKAIHIPDRSPSPLPACFRAAPADTQTMAEDTQTVPEDTQTVPEDTQTVPEDTQTVPEDTQFVPVNNQGRPAAGGPRPVAPSSSPDLGAPPSFDRRPRPSPAASLGRGSVPQAAPAIPLSQGSSTRAEELDKMAASLDWNERYRARAFAMRTDRSASQRSAIADLPEEDASEKADARRKAKGLPTKRKPKKAGLNCQGGYPSQAARRAVTDMSAYLFAAGPYIPSGNLLMLALECYERAFQVEFPGIPIEEPYPELILAIAERAPGARTVAKDHLRSLMTAKGGLGFHADPDTQTKVDENLQLYESIRDNFHFGSLDNPGSHYENPALKTGFVQAFFRDSYAPCAVYHTYFKPAATMQSIGVLLTLTETCIHEWRTGKFKKAHLDSKVQGVMYEKHMRNLRVFARAAPDRFERMCISFYKAGCDNAVPEAMGDSGEDVQPTIRLEDIRPDTPPPATPGATNSGGDV